MNVAHVGTSGNEVHNDRLAKYFEQLRSIELALPDREAGARLSAVVEAMPPGGSISIQAPDDLLIGEPGPAAERLTAFYEQIAPLDERLGAVLHTVPADFEYSPTRLASLLDLLPGGYRHALQFKGTDWYKERLREFLEEREIALCLHDLSGRVAPGWVTASFLYVRYTAEEYTSDELQTLAGRLDPHLERGRTVFAYFVGQPLTVALDLAGQLVVRLDQP